MMRHCAAGILTVNNINCTFGDLIQKLFEAGGDLSIDFKGL